MGGNGRAAVAAAAAVMQSLLPAYTLHGRIVLHTMYSWCSALLRGLAGWSALYSLLPHLPCCMPVLSRAAAGDPEEPRALLQGVD